MMVLSNAAASNIPAAFALLLCLAFMFCCQMFDPMPSKEDFVRLIEEELWASGLAPVGRLKIDEYSKSTIYATFRLSQTPASYELPQSVSAQALRSIIKVLTAEGCDVHKRGLTIVVWAQSPGPASVAITYGNTTYDGRLRKLEWSKF